MNEQLAQQFQEQGFVVFKGAVPPAEVEALRGDMERAIAKKAKPIRFDEASVQTIRAVPDLYKDAEGRVFRRLERVIERGGAFEQVVRRRIAPAAAQIMAAPIYVFLNRHNMVMLKAPYNPTPVYWHQDASQWNEGIFDHVTAIVPLDDFRADNGALEVVPGSHAFGPIAVGPDAERHRRLLRDEYGELIDTKAVKLLLKAGDLLLFHGLLFHGSAGNLSANRRGSLTIALHSGDPRTISTQTDEKAPQVMAV